MYSTLFFKSNRKSTNHGYISQCETCLGDFSGEIINDLNQTIYDYISGNKLIGKPRLYLLTRKKSWLSRQSTLIDTDSDSDFEFENVSILPLSNGSWLLVCSDFTIELDQNGLKHSQNIIVYNKRHWYRGPKTCQV